jgi:hypothetical protein
MFSGTIAGSMRLHGHRLAVVFLLVQQRIRGYRLGVPVGFASMIIAYCVGFASMIIAYCAWASPP